jgi:hypothetical protein
MVRRRIQIRQYALPGPSFRRRPDLGERRSVSLAELDALFASLQHRAFRGEL